MKKSIILSAFALLFSVATFAQGTEQKPAEHKAPDAKEIAQRRADMMRKQFLLDDDQYDKVYKLCLKQSKKDVARSEQMKKEREQMNKKMRGVLNDAQWEKYEKMQKRQFAKGKQIRRPGKPAEPGKPMPRPIVKKGEFQKGPQVEKPQGKKNNMYIEKDNK